MRNIRLFERRDFLRDELDGERGDGIFKMMRLGGTYDRCGDGGLGKKPCKRHLRARNPALLGDLAQAVDDFVVGVFRFSIKKLAESIRLGA
jgi:hypothetical protein